MRPAEVTTALLMTLDGFLLLAAYSCIKPVREALILAQPGGAEYKVYMAGGTAVVLSLAIPLYSRFSRNLPRNRLIVGLTLFFAANLVVFYGFGSLLGPSLAFALGFYLWIAVFNMMIVAQFWAFANDLYTDEAGRRLFALFGLGASIGAVAGSGAARLLLQRVGTLGMMPVAAALLLASAALTQAVHRREVRNARTPGERGVALRAIGGRAGEAFRLILSHRYLLLIAAFSLLFTLVKTNGDYILARLVKASADQALAAGTLAPSQVQSFIGGFFAQYGFLVDVLSLLIQAFAVSRLVRYLGVGGSFYVLPIVALGNAVVMVAVPVLAFVMIGKIAESSVDYSLNNTLRGILWLPTSRRAKYLAKQASDTFFVRMGDVASAVVVFAGFNLLGFSLRAFASVSVVLVCGWLVLAAAILRERARLRARRDEEGPETETAPAVPEA